MTGTITVYFNTGFNGVDIPASASVLQSASKKTYNDVYYMREDIDKPTIRIKDSYENLCAVDYCAITTARGTSYYFASPKAISKGNTLLALDLDALLTMGGAANLDYISGWQERGHIKKSEDTVFGNIASEAWIPSQPLMNVNMTKLEANSSSAPAADMHIVVTSTDLASLYNNNYEQQVISGVKNGEDKMYFPLVPSVKSSTTFGMWDFDSGQTKVFSIPQVKAHALKDFTQANNPDIAGTLDALEFLYSCGQLELQNSYIIPKEYIESWSGPSLTGDLGSITCFHGSEALTGMPYEYTIPNYTVKNKKVFSTYRQYALACVGSGDMIIKDAENLYRSGDSYPTVNIWADPCSTGKPYGRFAYIKGAPVQFTDCVKGLQWANRQLVMEGASGSLWNSVDNAFANQQLQRQQSMNTFNASVAAQSYELAQQRSDTALKYSTMGAGVGVLSDISGMIGANFSRNAKGGPINELDLGSKMSGNGFGIANKNLSLAQAYEMNGLQLQQLWNEMNATSSRAEMENNSLQNAINQNNIGLIRNNQLVAPTVSFTPEQNLGLYGYNYFVVFEIRKSDDDLKSEDMYYQRYGYNGLHRPLTAQCFDERDYYSYVQAFDVNLKGSAEFGLRVRTKAIAQLNKGVRVWKVLPDASYYETN